MNEAMKEAIFSALAAADGPVPENYARDHGYRRTGTHGYVTDNDWHAFRADAVLAAIHVTGAIDALRGAISLLRLADINVDAFGGEEDPEYIQSKAAWDADIARFSAALAKATGGEQ